MALARVLNHILHRRIHLIMPTTSYYFNIVPNIKHNVYYSTKKSVIKLESNETDKKVQISSAEKVKEKFKSAGYLGVTISGVGITAFIIYALVSELFSSKSPHAVYNEARIRCMEHLKLKDVLGEPIKAYGDETQRRRRKIINHMNYFKNGVPYMRIKFYVEGTRRRGTVYAEVRENASGKYEFTYVYVIVNHYGTIVIEDNQDKVKVSQDFISDYK